MIVPSSSSEPELQRNGSRGRIVTFYSYKGGTGRSMALANIAWLLAMAGKQVLVVDWDLEAPGLHRYFHPFLKDKELRESDGIIDLVIQFEDAATARCHKKAQADEDTDPDWYRPLGNILRYARSLDYPFPEPGTLDFVPAGRQTSSYAARVNSFNWQNFYEKLGGWALFEEAKRIMVEEYDYILIDSRTGVSDSAGICTIQLPNDLVVCYTLNTQSIEGASAVAASVLAKRARWKDFPLRVFPIAMRVEDAEVDKRELRRDFARAKFFPFLMHIPSERQEKYWGESIVPYKPFYAYEELLAYFKERLTESETLLSAMLRITTLITGETLSLPSMEVQEQKQILRQFAGFSREAPELGAGADQDTIYCSASVGDRDAAHGIIFLLRGHVSDRIRPPELADNSELDLNNIGRTLAESRTFLFFVGRHGISDVQFQELSLAIEEGRQNRAFLILPILLPGADLDPPPGLLAAFPPVDLRDHRIDQSAIDPLVTAIQETDTRSLKTRDSFSPYPGLKPFDEGDAPIFFGRELFAEVLRQKLNLNKLVILTGPTGAGKSSLVYAGLVPLLRRQLRPDPRWDIAPQPSLNDAILTLTPAATQSIVAGSASDGDKPREGAAQSRSKLLIADAVTLSPNLISFLEKARQRLKDTDSHLLVIVDTRPEEDIGFDESEFKLPRPTEDERRRMIEQPALTAKLEFEEGLIGEILDETSAVSLPILAFALELLWKQRHEGKLTREAWLRLRPVGAVVDRWAEEKFGQISLAQQEVAQKLWPALVRNDDGNICLREVAWSALDPADASIASLLIDVGLYIAAKNADTLQRSFQLAYPILTTEWARLRTWLDQSQDFLRWRQTIAPLSRRWLSRPADYMLIQGDAVAEAIRWRDVRGNELTPGETEFIAASEDAQMRLNERLRFEAAKKRRRKLAIWATVLLAIILGPGSLLWSYQHKRILLSEAAKQIKVHQYQAAEGTLKIALSSLWNRLIPDPRLYSSHGDVSVALGNLVEAETDYTRALSLRADDISTLESRAYVYRSTKHWNDAIGDYNRILRLDPSNAQAKLDLEYAYQLQRRQGIQQRVKQGTRLRSLGAN